MLGIVSACLIKDGASVLRNADGELTKLNGVIYLRDGRFVQVRLIPVEKESVDEIRAEMHRLVDEYIDLMKDVFNSGEKKRDEKTTPS